MAAGDASLNTTTATPILDRVVPVPLPGKHLSIWRFLAGLMMGAGIGVAFAFLDRDLLPAGAHAYIQHAVAGLNPIGFLAVILVGNYAIVVIHELGHVVLGLCAGFTFNYVSFGPLMIGRDGRISFHWKRKSGSRGQTSLFPKEGSSSRFSYMLMIVGGATANLASAACVAVYQVFSGNDSPELSVLVWLSVLVGLVNLVPFRYIAAVSDGKRIWMLLFQKRKAERWLAAAQLGRSLMGGIAPGELDETLLSAATSVIDRSPDTVSGHALAYSRAFDRHEDEKAAQMLEICLKYCRFTAPSVREGLFVTAAVFQARRRGQVELAQQWLGSVPAKTRTPGIRQQAEAAILEAQGRISESLAMLEESRIASLAIPQTSSRQITLNSLERWKAELMSQAPTAAV